MTFKRGGVDRAPLASYLLLAVLGCSSPEEASLVAQLPVIGGSETATCQWPTTVYAGCSATLVAPTLITLAAHCIKLSPGAPREILLGESGSSGKRTVAVKTCKAHDKFNLAGNPQQIGEYDVAFCVLQEPVRDVPIVPVLHACEAEVLKEGLPVTLVGYGSTATGSTQPYHGNPNRNKHHVATKIARLGGGNLVAIGEDGKGGCHGDSGGSAFIQMADKSWRAIGITSGGAECGKPGNYVLIHKWTRWIEDESGVDITPCEGNDGKWSAGPGCGNFPLEPGVAHGSWANGCSGGPTSKALTSCSAAPGDSPGTSSGGAPGTSSGGAPGTSSGGAPGTSPGGSPGASPGASPSEPMPSPGDDADDKGSDKSPQASDGDLGGDEDSSGAENDASKGGGCSVASARSPSYGFAFFVTVVGATSLLQRRRSTRRSRSASRSAVT